MVSPKERRSDLGEMWQCVSRESEEAAPANFNLLQRCILSRPHALGGRRGPTLLCRSVMAAHSGVGAEKQAANPCPGRVGAKAILPAQLIMRIVLSQQVVILQPTILYCVGNWMGTVENSVMDWR